MNIPETKGESSETESESKEDQEEVTETTVDEVDIHHILSSKRRYESLRILIDEDGGTVRVRDLADRVAEIESDESPPPSNKRKSVYVSLHQTHLPKLEKLDVINYDENTKEVEISDGIDSLTERYMVLSDQNDDEDGAEKEKNGLKLRDMSLSAVSGLGVFSVVSSKILSVFQPWLVSVFFLSVVFVYSMSGAELVEYSLSRALSDKTS